MYRLQSSTDISFLLDATVSQIVVASAAQMKAIGIRDHWKRCALALIFALLPQMLFAEAAGTKQIASVRMTTDEGEVLTAQAPRGELKFISFVSHGDHWAIHAGDIPLHGGKLALAGLDLTYGPLTDKAGSRLVTVLNVPVVFSSKRDGRTSYDEGRLEIDFRSGGDASVDLWREQASDTAIEHVEVKQDR